ncbi:hypothetical protein AG1IA_10381 [Rhizoctonia solani AG-1 IA]|uniref:Uncharacterized protein n=1 Tax=Thanatephorus cucumeris (strain AG1-IA) TaxID=983506 RepID=L8WGR9_THACA|nr:hypothetical protein AG1IA_10381 [Rhizoctonia solani AG-1 IA]
MAHSTDWLGLASHSVQGRGHILQLKTYLAIISRAFFFKPVLPEVDDWGVVEVVTNRPRMCYVSLERWDSKNGS